MKDQINRLIQAIERGSLLKEVIGDHTFMIAPDLFYKKKNPDGIVALYVYKPSADLEKLTPSNSAQENSMIRLLRDFESGKRYIKEFKDGHIVLMKTENI